MADVARALVRVGEGASYAEVARRISSPEEDTDSRNSQLVRHWVDLFAPVVAEPFAETDWPKVIAVDSTSFYPGNKSTIGFSVMAAVGYDHKDDRGRVVALKAVEGAVTKAKWQWFFRQLGGSPEMVISDGDETQLKALDAFPVTPMVRRCRWHVMKEWREILTNRRTRIPHAQVVWDIVAVSPYTPQSWDFLLDDIAVFTQGRNPIQRANFEKWYRKHYQLIADDLKEAGQRGIYYGWTVGKVEWAIREVKAAIKPRAFGLRNAYRTGLLLELIRLRLNRRDTFEGYLRTITDHFADTNLTLDKQRRHNDPGGVPSLHGW